jgi:hypothetical protein
MSNSSVSRTPFLKDIYVAQHELCQISWGVAFQIGGRRAQIQRNNRQIFRESRFDLFLDPLFHSLEGEKKEGGGINNKGLPPAAVFSEWRL